MKNQSTPAQVVITGMGIICPIGLDVETAWQAMLSGKSGVAPTTVFDSSTMPTQFAAEVKEYDVAKYVQNPHLHKNANRGSQFVLGATVQACQQADISLETDPPSDQIDRTRLGIYLGAGEGAVNTDAFFGALVAGWEKEQRAMDWGQWAKVAFEQMDPLHELEQEPNMPAAHLALLTGARGPTRSCLTACAASTQAVGEAYDILQNGEADVMIAGGAHSMIHHLGVMGFNRLTALSTRNEQPELASRPFSNSRDGFVLGEGAAILILETLASAKRRGVAILAEIIGYGSSADAFRVTDMHDEARGAIAAIELALKDANIAPEAIDYINAHGTSTAENDSIETMAIKRVFGPHAHNIPISSVKSTMGHLIGAAGAAELIACVLALRDNTLPPTANLHDSDPQLDLDYVPNEPRRADLNIVLNESFGFGGQNNVVISQRYTG